MAARKTTAIKGSMVGEEWRKRIQTSMLVNRLTEHVKGEIELTPTQVSAANILLKKTAPDLQAISVGQDPDKGPLQFKWIGE